MLYVLYTMKVLPGKMTEYHDAISKFLVLVEKYGAETLGVWSTAVGERDTVTILERYNDMGHFEKTRAKIEKDPLARNLLPKLSLLRTVTSKFMTPTSYSAMR